MNNKNLVSFGDSVTFGDGLPDTYPQHKIPSNFAWPKILADQLNVTCINNGRSGASSLEILDAILHHKFNDNDLVFVLWSFRNRDLIYTPDGKIQVGPWIDNDITKTWILTHNDHDMNVRTWLYLHHAHLYLKSLNLKFYFMYNFTRKENPKIFEDAKPKFINDVQFLKTDARKFKHLRPLALDNSHPGIEFHKHFANAIYSEISSI